MYRKPTKKQVEYAIECGWKRETAERGFALFEFDTTGLLQVARIDDEWVGEENEATDEDCAREAERIGICKIIPVNELPENFLYKYHIFVDTPENREAIYKMCN